VHYTLHFDGRKRRIRRSLGTRAIDVAIQRRDELLSRLAAEGEPVPERRPTRTTLAIAVSPVALRYLCLTT
jgi:hypothetical protein